jgi:hypothetical protein
MIRSRWERRVEDPTSNTREWIVLAGVFAAALALTLIAWWPVHDGWFLLDDYRWLPPSKRRFDLLKSLVGPWGHSFAYRPVMRLSFAADLQIFGLDPRGWHFHSFLAHALNATLLFALMRTTTGFAAPAAGVALLFVVSPLSHENVAWISGRTFITGALFFLLSANLVARAMLTAVEAHGDRLFRWGTIAFVAAMASYEPTVVFPLIVVVAVRAFPSIVAAPPAVVSRRVRQLFLILIVFLACRFVFLKGHLGAVNLTSSYWLYEPIRWWTDVWIRSGNPQRIAAPIAIAGAFAISYVMIRVRSAAVPAEARHLHAFLAVTAFLLFLPFINVVGIADRFLYLVQAVFIAILVLPLWLAARQSRAGAAAAVTVGLVLVVAGVMECRQAARDWADAGTVARSVADELKRQYPAWPEGVDVVLDEVPRSVGRAAVYVLYTKESVLQRYGGLDTGVYFGEELAASPEMRTARAARPAKYFRFDRHSHRLTELSLDAWEHAHDAPSRR